MATFPTDPAALGAVADGDLFPVTDASDTHNLKKLAASDLADFVLTKGPASRTITEDNDIVATDGNKILYVDSGSPVTLTLPLALGATMDSNTAVTIVQLGAGQVTLAEEHVDVTIDTPETLKLEKQNAAATLLYRSDNDYSLFGQLELL